MRKFLAPLENSLRFYFPKRMIGYKNIQNKLWGKSGIEIGGPTTHFGTKGFLPIYHIVSSLDNVNFSNNTVWDSNLNESNKFKFGDKYGRQIIREASDLRDLPNSNYDFLLSSHNIEHLANPLKTIKEWKRVVKPYGYFLFIVPNKEGTFDHNRPVTTIEHLVEDLTDNTTEADETHFEEVLTLHDLKADPGGLDFINFKERTLANFENRCVHHHVFDLELLSQVALISNIKILALQKFSKMHILLLGQNIK